MYICAPVLSPCEIGVMLLVSWSGGPMDGWFELWCPWEIQYPTGVICRGWDWFEVVGGIGVLGVLLVFHVGGVGVN